MRRRFGRRRRHHRVGIAPQLKWVGISVLIVAVLLATLALRKAEPPPPHVQATVVLTATSTNETDLAIGGETAAVIRAVAEQSGLIEQIKVDGDGKTVRQLVDMTPRQGDGAELKVLARRARAITEQLAAMQAEYNAFDATVSGRSVLAGLQAVEEAGQGPVIVFSALPDFNDPLDFRRLAFDVDPAAVVKQIKTAGDMPHHLAGREIVFVTTPVAGKQAPFRQPQTDYIRKVFTALIAAAGGSATFVTGIGGQPPGTAGVVPTVTIPDSTGTLKPATREETNPNGRTRFVTTCTLPAPMLFAPDRDDLLDPPEARRALRTCLKDTDRTTQISVDGHTARSGPDGDRRVAQELSTDRARVVADLLEDLGIKPHQITRIKGWGARNPIVKPASDPRNRAVVCTFTTIRTKGTNR